MSRARILFIFGFLISMAAGFVAGIVVGRTSPSEAVSVAPATQRSHGPHSMDEQLNLTPQQREQVGAIWAAVREAESHNGGIDRNSARTKRDEAIQKLVPEDRKADYDRVMQEYNAALASQKEEHERVIHDAEQKMKAVLTAEQWKKFEEIKRERSERFRGGRRGGPGGGGGATSSPITGTESHERP